MYWTTERIEEEAEALMEWVKDPKSWWFLDHCCERQIPKEMMSKLAKKNEKFKQAYIMARQKQESIVSKGCITKKLDGHFGWRFLSANYKYREETDSSGLEDEEAPGSIKGLAGVKETVIAHTNTLEQAGGKPS